MRTVNAFMQISLDGYFADANGGMQWAHKSPDDHEWNSFVAENARGGGELLFGRTTYEMMASFWPSPMAKEMQPVVADRMNQMPKTVFSRTLSKASWSNTTLVKEDLVPRVRAMKSEEGPSIAILGSGSLVTQLSGAGLVDQLKIVVNPLALGGGASLFGGIAKPLHFRLTESRAFKNGSVLLTYARG